MKPQIVGLLFFPNLTSNKDIFEQVNALRDGTRGYCAAFVARDPEVDPRGCYILVSTSLFSV